MKFAIIVFISLVIFFLILILLFMAGVFEPRDTSSEFVQETLNTISLQQGFCIPQTGDCDGVNVTGVRGECQLYETFSTEKVIVDKLAPLGQVPAVPGELFCDDGFVKALQEFQRTCMADECLGFDGNIYREGQVERYYKVCRNLRRCRNPRSAIVFNFFVNEQGKIATDKVRCLAASTQGGRVSFSAVVCPPQVTLESDAFLDVDQMPITIGMITAMFVRIRAPGTTDCLSVRTTGCPGTPPCLIVNPCENERNEGFVWLFTPLIPIRNDVGQIIDTFPPQLIQRPANLNDIDDSTPEALAQSLSIFPALQINEQDQLVLGKFGSCQNFTQNGMIRPTNDNCRFITAIITAYTWQEIFG